MGDTWDWGFWGIDFVKCFVGWNGGSACGLKNVIFVIIKRALKLIEGIWKWYLLCMGYDEIIKTFLVIFDQI